MSKGISIWLYFGWLSVVVHDGGFFDWCLEKVGIFRVEVDGGGW